MVKGLEKTLPRRPVVLTFCHPVTDVVHPSGLPSLSLSESMSVSRSAHSWRGHRCPEREKSSALLLLLSACASVMTTCVGVGNGTEGRIKRKGRRKMAAGDIHAKPAGAASAADGRRAFAGLHACCIGFVPSCARSALIPRPDGRSAAQKHQPGVLLLQRAGARAGRRKPHASSVQALLACPYPFGATLLHVCTPIHSM